MRVKSLERAFAVLAGATVLAGWAAMAGAQTCPAPLEDAKRLALATAETMDEESVLLELFVRDRPGAPWRRLGAPRKAVIGRAGMGWGLTFQRFGRAGEPVKREGDKRTPAGFFRIGASFGFEASERPGHVVLKRDETICVDDVRSPAYNTIRSRSEIGPKVSGENMRTYQIYRHGLFVDYPSSRKARAGSCIFLHLMPQSGRGTLGCVATDEMTLLGLQEFAEPGAVLGVVPRNALDRFGGCFPGL